MRAGPERPAYGKGPPCVDVIVCFVEEGAVVSDAELKRRQDGICWQDIRDLDCPLSPYAGLF